jgi:hypothetical protein
VDEQKESSLDAKKPPALACGGFYRNKTELPIVK